MNAVFAHDHVFVKWQGQVFSPGRLPYAAWARYLEHFQSVTVIARARNASSADDVKGMARSDGPRVKFAFQAGHRGVRRLFTGRTDDGRSLLELVDSADAVIARVPSRIGIKVAQLALRRDCPLAIEVVGSAVHALWHHGSLAAKAYGLVLDYQTKSVAQRSPSALYVTERYLQRRYPCAGFTAHASNVAIPTDPGALERRRSRILSRQGPLVVGFVGTLSDKHKGLDTLLRACARVMSMGVPCVIEVVGEGDTSSWRRLAASLNIESAVRFIGALPGSAAVREWMESIDVFALPSKGGEGLPRALIEAMSVGCLAFATDVGGVNELLPPSCLMRPRDEQRLASLILEAANARERLLDAALANISVAERYRADTLEATRRRFFSELAMRARQRLAGSTSSSNVQA